MFSTILIIASLITILCSLVGLWIHFASAPPHSDLDEIDHALIRNNLLDETDDCTHHESDPYTIAYWTSGHDHA